MTQQEHDHERIQRYLEGELPEAERHELEVRLQQDAGLRELLELHRDIDRQFGDTELQDFRHFLDEVRQEADRGGSAKKNRILPLRSLMLIAAAVAALVIAMIWLLPDRSEPQSPEQLFADYFQPEEVLVVPGLSRRGEQALDSTLRAEWITKAGKNWVRAFELYHLEKDPAAALAAFEQVEPGVQEAFATTYPLELGRLYLANDRAEDALDIFQQITGSPGKQAEWYSALALRQLDAEQARKALTQIAQDPDSDFRKKARDILQKMAD